jgi:hypothetical protein
MKEMLWSYVRTALAAVLLGATLGALFYVGLFFWQHQEVLPCAAAGLLGPQDMGYACPTSAALSRGVWVGALVGSFVGAAVGALGIYVLARRQRLMRSVSG